MFKNQTSAFYQIVAAKKNGQKWTKWTWVDKSGRGLKKTQNSDRRLQNFKREEFGSFL
jgi:hypothetical protein